MVLEQLQDALEVAGGNKPLVITLDTLSVVWVGIAMFLAILTAGFVVAFIATL